MAARKEKPRQRFAGRGDNESGRLKTVALSGHISSDLCIPQGADKVQSPLRKTEGESAVALPEATKKCGRGLALVMTNSEGR